MRSSRPFFPVRLSLTSRTKNSVFLISQRGFCWRTWPETSHSQISHPYPGLDYVHGRGSTWSNNPVNMQITWSSRGSSHHTKSFFFLHFLTSHTKSLFVIWGTIFPGCRPEVPNWCTDIVACTHCRYPRRVPYVTGPRSCIFRNMTVGRGTKDGYWEERDWLKKWMGLDNDTSGETVKSLLLK